VTQIERHIYQRVQLAMEDKENELLDNRLTCQNLPHQKLKEWVSCSFSTILRKAATDPTKFSLIPYFYP